MARNLEGGAVGVEAVEVLQCISRKGRVDSFAALSCAVVGHRSWFLEVSSSRLSTRYCMSRRPESIEAEEGIWTVI